MYYSVKKLAKLAGVSVRTLHLYDEIGLLKPSVRTEAKYRLYGEKELLRLQQILFYKELDFSLQAICQILDNPTFDVFQALENHKVALQARQDRLATLVLTIEKTIANLKGEIIMTPEELYKGLPKEMGTTYRQKAIEEYGQETIQRSENHLRSLGKAGFEQLKAEQKAITQALLALIHQDPTSTEVQEQIAQHYQNIRQFWGTAHLADPQTEAYKGLGQLYVSDERFTTTNGTPNPTFAVFLSKAMSYFADTQLV
ncbi:MAG: MerR family transcriptional regulator [Spirosomataceae bacterium]